MPEILIPQKYLDRLQELGLWFCVAPSCYNFGVRIYKPTVAGGNGAPDYKATELVTLVEENNDLMAHALNPNSDASPVVLYERPDGKWVVDAVDCVGAMGPGDFCNIWDTAEEAIADIEDFYFGDSGRMDLKAAYKRGLNSSATVN